MGRPSWLDPVPACSAVQPTTRAAPPPRPSAWQRWGRNLALFLLTAASVFFVGGLRAVEVPGRGALFAIDPWGGARLAIGLLAILVAHEMGHYVAARLYGVDVTLPFFIPFPVPGMSLVGTLGAFIRIRSPIPHRRALFDIGVAGPLAGFLVCLPVLWLGIREATVQPLAHDAEGLFLGEPLLFRWLTRSIHGPVPADHTLLMGPLGLAAWFGLLVTALNLMPIGQLDGGHVTYALLRDRAHADLADRLVGLRGARLLRPELDPVGDPDARARPASPADPRRRRARGPRPRRRGPAEPRRLRRCASCPTRSSFSWRDFFEATGLGTSQPRPAT